MRITREMITWSNMTALRMLFSMLTCLTSVGEICIVLHSIFFSILQFSDLCGLRIFCFSFLFFCIA